ncbi:MAG: FAD binding domain-containing protein [Planctomycetes bacterium]|nr:FAD binding domain-containing protein [Planctomycetota bacterium]
MKPFTYVVPKSLADASDEAKKPNTLVKGAGVDLIDRMKERLQTPERIVNLLPLKDELAGIAVEADGELRIGALTTLSQLEQHEALAAPALAGLRESATATASPQIRNRATVAGNILQFTRCWYVRSEAFRCLHGGRGPTCLAMTGENRYHAVLGWLDCVRVHPSNLAPPLLALDAEYTTKLGEQIRRRKFTDLFPAEPKAQNAEHTLEVGEIVTAIHVPKPAAGTRTAYCESREKATFDWATTACAVKVVLAGGKITAANLVLGAVAPVPLPRPKAAAMLVGQTPSDTLFQKVAEAAYAGASPLAHNDYKLTVGKAVVREALAQATR